MKKNKKIIFILIGLFITVILSGLFLGSTMTLNPVILWKIRLPRVLLGFFVGGMLASSGVLFQGLLRNPLADPYILGTSSGAALGLMLALMAGLSYGSFGVYVFVILGAAIITMLTYSLARVEGRVPVLNLLLAGYFSAFVNNLIIN